ncbi:hypothetical protein F0562_004862 [Nyssa sinensis]|uniref:C3H1-type domain-containing protein n=1 Tax=Nyssa sinensis TaxID=561372 RepID=A0A5J5AGM1_9ASTE|nr:hypothetical protein F0562_004862 [Nyssa sinensis]
MDSHDVPEEALVQNFQNVGLKSNENENENETSNDDHKDHGNLNGSRLYPLRLYAEDCPFFMRTGTCKFGLNCKFNHPVRRTNQAGRDKDKEKEGSSENSEQIECKYYLTPGGCKYGKSCRYNHSKDESEIEPPELNFLGLPVRLGEKECPFYMRNGSCGYGARCRFHHPDPTAVGGSDPQNSNSNDESVGPFVRSSESHNGNSITFSLSGASHPAQLSWSSQPAQVPYQDNHSSFVPATQPFPQVADQNLEWNGYQVSPIQAPNYPYEMTRQPHSDPAAKNLMKAGVSTQVEEFPERPGQPECDYFIKTGSCKFKSACRYHHPKIRAPKADVCDLSDKGLPLRPGKRICWNYERYGICKYGRACLFDHPVNLASSAFPVGSIQ